MHKWAAISSNKHDLRKSKWRFLHVSWVSVLPPCQQSYCHHSQWSLEPMPRLSGSGLGMSHSPDPIDWVASDYNEILNTQCKGKHVNADVFTCQFDYKHPAKNWISRHWRKPALPGRTLHVSKSSPELSGLTSLAEQPINTERPLLQWQDTVLWCGVL